MASAGAEICINSKWQPSIQKLVGNVAQDCLSFLTEESFHTDVFNEDTSSLEHALDELAQEFSPNLIDRALLDKALEKAPVRAAVKIQRYNEDVRLCRLVNADSYSHFLIRCNPS